MSKKIPFSIPKSYEPSSFSPYYHEDHKKFIKVVKDFVDEYILPNREEYEEAARIPDHIYEKAGELGILSASCQWPENGPIKRPNNFDGFFSLICMDELSRCGSGGIVWGLIGGLCIGLSPIIHEGPEWMQEEIVKPCLLGKKKIALAVSEANAGSDIANLQASADECVVDGVECYKINGLKKWITVGEFADYYTVAARVNGQKGMFGINLILVERNRKGVSVRPMDCMGAKGSGTAYIEFDDVIVPKTNYIGSVLTLLRNFVTERLGLAIQAVSFSRVLLTESIEYSRRRKAFGKSLTEQPVVRQKIANMIMKVESSQAYLESLANRLSCLEKGGGDFMEGILKIGAEASLAKVLSTRCFEFCAREASLIHGGNSYVKGNRVEHLYRHVLSLAIPGGSDDVLVDNAARLVLKGKL